MSSNSATVTSGERGTPWYVAYTKPRAEALALDHLQRQGYDTWYPRLKVISRKAVPGAPVTDEALFPRYVFVRPSSPQQSIAPIKSTQGVTKLVTFGFEPARLSHAKLCQIADWVEQQRQASPAELAGLVPGTPVRITQSPFAELQGLVRMTGPDRVLVLLNLMGQDQTLSLPYFAVAAV